MTQWLDFLNTEGATIAEEGNYQYVQSFQPPAIEAELSSKHTVMADLSHLGLLELHGADAVTFLQGQVTNDVTKLDGSNSHYSGYCTAKGRLLALFLAFVHQDHLHLQFNRQLLEPIAKRLRMYVLRSKVTITDKSNDIIRLGLAGPEATSLVAQHFDVALDVHALVTQEHVTILRLPDTATGARYQLLTNEAHAEFLWRTLSPEAKPVGKEAWEWLELQAGIPDIAPATQESFVPQMVNLDLLQGINFKKGCYTGQEIVARTHYLGKVKRRTVLTHFNANALPVLGASIHTKESTEAIGQVVRSAIAPQGGFDVLVEARLEHILANNLWMGEHALSLLPMPYGVETE